MAFSTIAEMEHQIAKDKVREARKDAKRTAAKLFDSRMLDLQIKKVTLLLPVPDVLKFQEAAKQARIAHKERMKFKAPEVDPAFQASNVPVERQDSPEEAKYRAELLTQGWDNDEITKQFKLDDEMG